ncbi:MAG: Asp23/Gls24 family envelope stress response protein, partial [Actinomycetota bacterium]|nr:Asp23/Gls24 family envelope stress response protein [Actinomycetota bacterium]
SIVDSVLRRIRGAVEYPNYGVVESPDGLTRISARVVVVTARETAQAVPGVRVALSKRIISSVGEGDYSLGGYSDEVDGTEVTAGMAGRSTAVEITLAADYGLDLRRLGERVRAEVSARIRTLTDLEPVQVTVIIDDVFG